MATIQVDIVSAEGEIYAGEASMVFAPASMGEVGIAPRHAPMLTMLKPGEIRVQDADGNEEAFYITGGMLEVQPNLVTVLADTALRGDQLDEAAALSAQQEAEKALEGASAETDIARAQALSRRPEAQGQRLGHTQRVIRKGRPGGLFYGTGHPISVDLLWCPVPY
jgi:F-type H+-transporting ATPase subunit epsilon